MRKYRFKDVEVTVEGNTVRIQRDGSGFLITIPLEKFRVRFRERRKPCRLRDFESQILCEKRGNVLKLRDILTIEFRHGRKKYLVFIVKDDDLYHVFHGWSWFDGDKFGFISEGAI